MNMPTTESQACPTSDVFEYDIQSVMPSPENNQLYRPVNPKDPDKITAMLTMAESEPGMPVLPAELDVDPWLFNCPNGTLDLHTGQLRPHDRPARDPLRGGQ
jgi:phage/plasmid-associated DNA primase